MQEEIKKAYKESWKIYSFIFGEDHFWVQYLNQKISQSWIIIWLNSDNKRKRILSLIFENFLFPKKISHFGVKTKQFFIFSWINKLDLQVPFQGVECTMNSIQKKRSPGGKEMNS